ncbi:MAG TPA: HlyD family efflux transporter periplasmic adaptor subunit, partial [Bryobacteraceae bacterium]|nr:HlyD family efflux transporter periplasmic adaptor subunit [Bryobacteraceae bacterium]
MKRKRSLITAVVLIALAAAGGFGVYRMRNVQAAETLAVAPARKGDFLVIVRARGELKARMSSLVTAPVNVPELRIVWMAPQGGAIKAGDPIIRFDPSSATNQLNEKKALLAQAQAALDQAVAQAAIQTEQDKLDLAAAEYQVERAKLEASKAEIVSRLKGEESRVDLDMAGTRLNVQRSTVDLGKASNTSKIASLTRARDKAQEEVKLTEHRLSLMELKAPLTGVLHVLPNYQNGWQNAKPFKVGDQAWPGGAIAEVPALDSLEMEGKLDEIDRGKLKDLMEIRVRLDALPEITFPAKLAQVSPMTVMGWEWPPTRTFRGFAKIEKLDDRLRPGMNGSMDVVIDRIPGA